MSFTKNYFQMNIEQIKELNSINEVPDVNSFETEFGSIEQYKDIDGILHIKTVFNHDDIDENDLWEVYNASDGTCPLELLLNL